MRSSFLTGTLGLAALCATLLSGASTGLAATANGPICDPNAKVNSTTYYGCGGSSHTALDIANGTCSVWNYRAMLVGSFRYTAYAGCGDSCGSCSGSSCCNGGAGNYFVVSGGSGWDFRQLHSNAPKGTQTCDRCALGLIGSTGNSTGAHSHSDNRQYGTRKSAWYTAAGTTCGSSGNCSNRVGVPTL